MRKFNSLFNRVLKSFTDVDINDIITKHEELNTKFNNLKKELTKEKKARTDNISEIANAKVEVDKLKQKLSKCQDETREFNSQVLAFDSLISSLHTQLIEEQQKTTDYEQLKNDYEKVKEQLRSNEGKNQELEERLSTQNDSLTLLHNQLLEEQQRTADYEQLKNDYEKVKEQLRSSEGKNQELEERVDYENIKERLQLSAGQKKGQERDNFITNETTEEVVGEIIEDKSVIEESVDKVTNIPTENGSTIGQPFINKSWENNENTEIPVENVADEDIEIEDVSNTNDPNDELIGETIENEPIIEDIISDIYENPIKGDSNTEVPINEVMNENIEGTNTEGYTKGEETNTSEESFDMMDDVEDEDFTYIDERVYPDIIVQAQKLGIPSVFDVTENKYYDSKSFFQKDESELMLWRRTLQEAITTEKPRFICPQCKQMVKISGHKTRRGRVCYFAHIKDSDDCTYKSNSDKTKKQIEIEKYGLVQESNRHKKLKELICRALEGDNSKQLGVTNVACEKRIDSKLPYMNYRRPDVCADWNGRHLVFELQLSTTFISVIVDRDIFYRLNNYDIIWVFNFDENSEYVNLYNLMCKDIYYANKRNVFIFDREAQELSEKNGQLMLKCRWLDENNKWSADKIISLSDLKFDENHHKPYVYDADANYFINHPDVLQRRISIENTREYLIKALFEREEREKEKAKKWENEIESLKKQIWTNGETVDYFKDKNKYGFQYDSKIILSPKYTSMQKLDSGYFEVGFNKKVGIVRRDGIEVVPVSYKKVMIINSRFDVILALNKTVDLYVHCNKFEIDESFDDKEQSVICETEENVAKYVLKTNKYGYNWHSGYYGSYRTKYSDGQSSWTMFNVCENKDFVHIKCNSCDIIATSSEVVDFSDYKSLRPLGYDNMFVATNIENKCQGVIDIKGHPVIDFTFEKLLKTNSEFVLYSTQGVWGIMDCYGNKYSECFAQRILYLGKDYFAYSNSNLWGICDKFGTILTDELYTLIHLSDNTFVNVAFSKDFLKKWTSDEGCISYMIEDDKLCLSSIDGKLQYSDSKYGKYLIRKSGEIYALYLDDETQMLNFEFLDISFVAEDVFIVKRLDNTYTLYNAGTNVFGEAFQSITKLDGNILMYVKDNKFAIGNIQQIKSEYYDAIKPININRYIAVTKHKIGYWYSEFYRSENIIIDKEGKNITENVFEYIFDFYDGVATAEYKGRQGKIDIDGNLLEECVEKLDSNYTVYKSFERSYIKNTSGEKVSPEFTTITFLCEGYYSIQLCGSNDYQVYSTFTKRVSSSSYQEICLLTSNIFKAKSASTSEWLLLKGEDNIYDTSFQEICLLEDGFVGLSKKVYKTWGYSSIEWHIGNIDGRPLLDVVVDKCPSVENGIIIHCIINGFKGTLDPSGLRNSIVVFENENYIIKERFGEYCLENKDNSIIIDYSAGYTCIGSLTDHLVRVSNQEKMNALFDCYGKKVTDFIYSSIVYNNQEKCFDVNKDGIKGRLDIDGNVLDSERIEVFNGECFIVNQFELFGLKNSNEAFLIPCIYRTMIEAPEKILIVEDKNGRWSLLASSGKRLTKKYYQHIKRDENHIIAKRNNVEGLLTSNGDEEQLERVVSNDYKIVSAFEKQTLVNPNGEVCLSEDFDSIQELHEGLFSVKKNSLFALASCNKIISDFKYKEFDVLDEYIVALSSVKKISKIKKTGYGYRGNPYTYWDTDVSYADKWGLLNKLGHVVLSFNFDKKPISQNGKIIAQKGSKDVEFTKEHIQEKESTFDGFEVGKDNEVTITGFSQGGVIVKLDDRKFFIPLKALYTSTKTLSKGTVFILVYNGFDKNGYPIWDTRRKNKS